ncbi:MAG: PIN domain-containing protein [Candidatus Competibacteraceae bacterium]|uniref:PIN domain-containing protein n=1 Tax=Candidatus Contendobacter odensis Run_B_J11 TaxID=1400861 RepID=A0A7U7G9U8_9GAMM|nr:PIN domain-containing protein [Candidatus Contendobacter odensis]MBK8536277.1 PIN domain-containing protein [Candidatus Competibacteraceae bacterium]CDH44321.1 hypothetical protein BN874_1600002 [Candidatus Contendobacter odensis Run_B_J11]
MLVDTSVWIDYFNGYASAEADRLAQAISDHESIILCSVVMTEILLGLRSDAEATRIAELLAAFTMAPEPDRMDYLLRSGHPLSALPLPRLDHPLHYRLSDRPDLPSA